MPRATLHAIPAPTPLSSFAIRSQADIAYVHGFDGAAFAFAAARCFDPHDCRRAELVRLALELRASA